MTKQVDNVPVQRIYDGQVPDGSVPFKLTTVGKSVRTFLQATAGIGSIVVTALLASEEFKSLIGANPEWAWLLVAFPIATTVFTYLQNALDPTVKTI